MDNLVLGLKHVKASKDRYPRLNLFDVDKPTVQDTGTGKVDIS